MRPIPLWLDALVILCLVTLLFFVGVVLVSAVRVAA